MTIRPFAKRAPMSPIDEPADQVAEPEPGLEEAVRRLPAEAGVGERQPGRSSASARSTMPEAELADGALERVREQDRLVAQELPAGRHLGDGSPVAPGRVHRPLATRVGLDDDRREQRRRREVGRAVDPEGERDRAAEERPRRARPAGSR